MENRPRSFELLPLPVRPPSDPPAPTADRPAVSSPRGQTAPVPAAPVSSPGDRRIGRDAAPRAIAPQSARDAKWEADREIQRQRETAALCAAARQHCDRGEFDAALEVARRAVRRHPQSARAHRALGDAWFRLKRSDPARRAYERATQLDPAAAEAWANLGAVCHRRGDRDRAVACYRTALTANPRLFRPHLNLAMAAFAAPNPTSPDRTAVRAAAPKENRLAGKAIDKALDKATDKALDKATDRATDRAAAKPPDAEPARRFDRYRYLVLKSLVGRDWLALATRYVRLLELRGEMGTGDDQIPNSPCAYGDPLMEFLLEALRPTLEAASGLSLLPTYSYFRIYQRGDRLQPHRDRPACEISLTLTLSADGPPWPICLRAGKAPDVDAPATALRDSPPETLRERAIALGSGDGLLYRGCELLHWRDPFPGDRQVQAFLHYVDRHGPSADWRYDRRPQLGTVEPDIC